MLAATQTSSRSCDFASTSRPDISRIDFDNTVVRAPVSGVVGNCQVRAGKFLTPGASVLEIVPAAAVGGAFSVGVLSAWSAAKTVRTRICDGAFRAESRAVQNEWRQQMAQRGLDGRTLRPRAFFAAQSSAKSATSSQPASIQVQCERLG